MDHQLQQLSRFCLEFERFGPRVHRIPFRVEDFPESYGVPAMRRNEPARLTGSRTAAYLASQHAADRLPVGRGTWTGSSGRSPTPAAVAC
ncbi:MAG TPA: hypothetical protein VHF06_08625, partial [Pseudonocardiaceae bacterium]|nr:hypothetical protein [Pseudonocardiaceae bacterium]